MARRDIIEGKLQGNERGYAFLIVDGGGEDYFIPHGDLRGAMHGDRVLCETTNGSGARTTARVLKVLERGIKEIVGTYFTCKSGGFITPDDRKYYSDIFIPFGKGVRAKSGDKVVCKILSYPKKMSPEGKISFEIRHVTIFLIRFRVHSPAFAGNRRDPERYPIE